MLTIWDVSSVDKSIRTTHPPNSMHDILLSFPGNILFYIMVNTHSRIYYYVKKRHFWDDTME